MAEIGSIRGYARHRKEKNLKGASDTAVRKAIATGRINKRADGKLDFEECDKLWVRNTDPVMQAPPKINRANLGANLSANPDENLDEHLEASVASLTLREKTLKIEKLETEIAEKRGTLVSKDNAIRIFATLARQERDSWNNWAHQVAAEMAADLGVEQHEMQTTLSRYVEMNLMRTTEMVIDVSPTTKL